MKLTSLILVAGIVVMGLASFISSMFTSGQKGPVQQSIYDFKIPALNGDTIDFSTYRGKNLIIVNTASKCGYTPQYADLEKLHEVYGNKAVVLGFPANNFGGQEPGSHAEIAAFCEKNYGVTFPVFEKISVAGDDMHPLYKYLSSKEMNGVTDEKPNWNFCKYLIDENGKVVKFFNSKVTPMSNEMLTAIHQ